MEEPIYVIGHRNPDADAICSAIGYAAFKEATGESGYLAARCGNSNARIDTILRLFDLPLPKFIGDVTPRVRDIMVTDVKKVHTDSICAEALELIDEYDVRTLPVVDHQDQLEGILTVFDLGGYFIPRPHQPREMRHVFTTINDIVHALSAQAVHTVEPDLLQDFFVRVGAMDIRSFGHFYAEEEGLARQSIIIVGDRYDIQQRSIQLGVRMLVITGGLPIEDDVVSMAKERGVSIISSPIDSATTSWLIRSASRVDRMMRRKFTTFRPEDRVAMARRRVGNLNTPAYMVVDDDNRLVGVFSKTDLLKPSRISLVLVDHNELSQAVPGADQVNIREVIDHHRLGNPPTEQPVLFINRPLGSTSTIIAEMFHREGVEPSRGVAGALMGGIISDTLNLQGPTTTEIDARLLQWLENIAGTSAEELASAIFSAGSVILSEKPQDVIRTDMKVYSEGDVSFSVSQVEELGFDNFRKHHRKLSAALGEIRKGEGLYFAALLVTDINSQNSLLLVEGEPEFIELIRYPFNAIGAFELVGIVSRKKQLIPYLTGMLRGAAPSHVMAPSTGQIEA